MEFSIVYGIGTLACTKEFFLKNNNIFNPLKKQTFISVPIITSITLNAYKNKVRNSLYSIYVGKEFDIKEKFESFLYEKYDISINEIMNLKKKGFDRFCLLSYKKYDQIIVGLETTDKVVPDYFALKRELLKLTKI